MTKVIEKPGICSITPDEKHVIMLDIDIKDLMYSERVSYELRELQKKHGLSDIYLFKTCNGYHAWCLDKFTLEEAWNIYKDFKYEDTKHAWVGYSRRKMWALRIGKDIHIIDTIHPYGEDRTPMKINARSNAHRIFLNMQYGMNIPYDLTFDSSTRCLSVTYIQKPKGHTTKNKVTKNKVKICTVKPAVEKCTG